MKQRQSCRYNLSGIIGFFILCSVLSESGYAEPDQVQYPIRHEIFEKNGVLVSQPRMIDRQISAIFEMNQIKNIEDYAAWLKKNIQFAKDSASDSWAEPYETLKNKRGDCEDFAFLNREVLQGLGYQPHFYALMKQGEAHAICVFKKDGYYVWFDNATLKKTKARTVREFVVFITETYDYIQVAELDTQKNMWSIIYRRS